MEANTLFQTLIDVLHKIDPIHLNATISAIAEGLRGHGDDFGATLAGLNQYLAQLNPKLPTLESDFAQTATVANIYGDAGPDLVTVINNVPTINNTIIDQQDNLNATLLAAIGLAERGNRHLGAGGRRFDRRDPAVAGAVEGARATIRRSSAAYC